jgi:serine/threonine protein kinase
MLVGRDPFAHFEDPQVLAAHESHQPEAPSRLAIAPLPPELDHAVLKSLAKDPSQRFQTAMEFCMELQAIAQQLQLRQADSGVRELALGQADAATPLPARRVSGLRAVIGFGIGFAIGGLVALGLAVVMGGQLHFR